MNEKNWQDLLVQINALTTSEKRRLMGYIEGFLDAEEIAEEKR